MVDIGRVDQIARENFRYQIGQFYGQPLGQPLGAGLVYRNVRFPVLNEENFLFDTAQGLVYILTHECDIDQNNARYFNEYLLICPIIQFEDLAEEFDSRYSEESLITLVTSIANDRVFRVFYFPPIGTMLPYGGLLYLNQICSTHIRFFDATGVDAVTALSTYAQERLDRKLYNHLLRPKESPLPRLS